ncbi:MAG: hypothetical protein ABJA82_01940 [Myxococcales bacterium]
MRIADRFGLKVQVPFQVELASGQLAVPVLLEQFGAQRGMLLFTSYQDIAAVTEQLVSAGFGYSCLDDSLETDLDESQIVDMLRDWGWSGGGEAPSWYAA